MRQALGPLAAWLRFSHAQRRAPTAPGMADADVVGAAAFPRSSLAVDSGIEDVAARRVGRERAGGAAALSVNLSRDAFASSCSEAARRVRP